MQLGFPTSLTVGAVYPERGPASQESEGEVVRRYSKTSVDPCKFSDIGLRPDGDASLPKESWVYNGQRLCFDTQAWEAALRGALGNINPGGSVSYDSSHTAHAELGHGAGEKFIPPGGDDVSWPMCLHFD